MRARRSLITIAYRAAAALLGAAVVMMTVQIVLRSMFSSPMAWAEEVVRYAFVWSVYLGSTLAVAHDSHIRVLTLVDPFGERGRRISNAATWLVNLVCFAFLAYWGFDLAWNYRHAQFYTVPGMPQIIFYLSLPICMTAMIALLLLPGRSKNEKPQGEL